MSIGNSINSLPLAYSPLDGTGRKVTYGLSHQTLESSIDPVPTVISNAMSGMDAELSATMTGLKLVDLHISESVEAESFPTAVFVAGGFSDCEMLGDVDPVFLVTKTSAFAEIVATAVLNPVPLRVRIPFSDFRTLYSEPGQSAVGNAINSFALGTSTLNSSVGVIWRTFITLCSPVGSLAVSFHVSEQAQSSFEPQGSALFAPSISSGADLSADIRGNTIFSSLPALEAEAAVWPKAMAYRLVGAIFEQDEANASGFGVIVAGGNANPEAGLTLSPAGTVLADLKSIIQGETDCAPIGNYAGDGFAITNAELSAFPQSMVARAAFIVAQAELDCDPIPWDSLLIIISNVYAQSWNSSLGIDIPQSIVYRVAPESVVYRVAPESIVYGRQNEI